jgi:aspartate racemase
MTSSREELAAKSIGRQNNLIGVLGGMSNQATAEYYRMINAAVKDRLGGWNIAEIIINSVNFGTIERCVRTGAWDEAGEYLAGKAMGVERAGADFLICVSNTMHCVADRFTAELDIPFLHIADPTGAAIRAAGLSRIGLLGTKPVMGSRYLRNYYAENFGIETLVPDEEDQVYVDQVIFDELVNGRFEAASKAGYLEVVDRLQQKGAEGVILGCTEIFLLISQSDRPNFPMFDTTALHVERIVDLALGEPMAAAGTDLRRAG